jgi:hypothetical protein
MIYLSLTQKELQEIFEIVDGELWRKAYVDKLGHKRPRKLVKNIANHADGYCDVKFKGRMVKYHRVIWILLNGDIQAGMDIDHIDGNKVNNEISNLRLVSNRENQQNQLKHRNGKLVGCNYHKPACKWQAKIQVNGKQKHLGLFSTEQEAHEAYKKALEGIEQCEFL